MSTPEDFNELEQLGEELRQQVGGEFRRTAEEDEFAAAKSQLRARTLEHVAYELLSRGDTIGITAGATRIQGIPVHAKGDLLALETLDGDRVDVHLGGPMAIQVLERAAAGGRTRDRYGAESFIARLRELELDEIPVEVLIPGADGAVGGIITAVTPDHIMVHNTETGPWFLPIAGIATVTVR